MGKLCSRDEEAEIINQLLLLNPFKPTIKPEDLQQPCIQACPTLKKKQTYMISITIDTELLSN
jgi:hypothetical protein